MIWEFATAGTEAYIISLSVNAVATITNSGWLLFAHETNLNGLCDIAVIYCDAWCHSVSVVTQTDRYNEYTWQTHTRIYTEVGGYSTWLGDHQERPPTSANSLFELGLRTARHQALHIITSQL